MDDATVVVTRGFVDRLPRDEQQAVIAHVMASIGNGDLTLAAEILTLLQAWGLVSLMLEAPLVPTARASLMLVGRTALHTLRGRADASSRELAVDTLLAGADLRERWTPTSSSGCRTSTRWCSCSATRRSCSRSAPPPSPAKAIIWLTVFAHGPVRVRAVADPPEAGGRDRDSAHALSGCAGGRVPDPRGPRHEGAGRGGGALPVSRVGSRGGSRTRAGTTSRAWCCTCSSRSSRGSGGWSGSARAADGAALAMPDPGYTWREVAAGAGWISVGAVLLAGVMALSVVGAAATLYALGWLLHKVLVAFPRWIAGLWS